MVSTDDGGPNDILARCANGLLVDTSDIDLIQKTLEQAFANKKLWINWRNNGIHSVKNHFSWNSHANKYLSIMRNKLNQDISPSLAKVIPLSRIKAS